MFVRDFTIGCLIGLLTTTMVGGMIILSGKCYDPTLYRIVTICIIVVSGLIFSFQGAKENVD